MNDLLWTAVLLFSTGCSMFNIREKHYDYLPVSVLTTVVALLSLSGVR